MMEKADEYSDKFERARKRVKELKGFYDHLKGFIIVNLLLILAVRGVLNYMSGKGEIIGTNILEWMNLNMIITPGLWGIGLIIHGLVVYRHKFTFLKKWEEKQIKKYIEEEQRNSDKYN